MRYFNYTKNYSIIGTTINGYITQMDKEIKLLKDMNANPIYKNGLSIIENFKTKYENLGYVSSLILKDLLEPENVEYCFLNGEYPKDASKIGMEFEADLKKIFVLEDELSKLAIEEWKNKLTNFDDIVNGEDFIVIGHASVSLPGTKEFSNYRTGEWSKQYLSCSLLSDKEFNTFDGIKTVYRADVNEDNYIASSNYDSVTHESKYPTFEVLKEIDDNGKKHYISVGYNNDIYKGVTTISTPQLIEQLSISRELEENGEIFKYDKSLTNEIILDRSTTKINGALLIGNGCDILINEYLTLKKNNIKFKCLNKGLYKEKYGLSAYTEEEFNEFMSSLSKIEEYINSFDSSLLLDYYNEVVIPMNYNVEINDIIKETFSKYVDIHNVGVR